MKPRSIFWPLVLIAAGILWLMVGADSLPATNLWALSHLFPYLLMMLGIGLILRPYWPYAGILVSILVVAGAVVAVVFAPQLGWAGQPGWNLNIGDDVGGAINGSGVLKTEIRPLEGFTSVIIRYPGEVVIQQGDSHKVTLTADDNLLPQLNTQVRNGILYIENTESDWDKRVKPSKSVTLTIETIELHEVDFSSAGSLVIEQLRDDELKLMMSGAGNATLQDLEINSLIGHLSGAGNITASGLVDTVDLRISGFGTYDGSELKSRTADIHISGAGQAIVWVEEQLNAEISGAGKVDFFGDPRVNQHINGAGAVTRIGDK